MDILTRENLSSIYIANMDFIHWSVRLCSRKRDNEVKGVEGGGIVILASYECHSIRVHENLVQHPINYIFFTSSLS